MDKEQYQQIERPAEECERCNVPLEGFSRHPSALREVSEKAVRQDLCPACWEKMNPDEFFSYWLSRREEKKTAKKKTRRETSALLLELFESLYDAGKEQRSAQLHVLAHLLMKMKAFKWMETRRRSSAPDIIVFRNESTKEVVELEDVQLEDDALVEAKKEIDELLAAVFR